MAHTIDFIFFDVAKCTCIVVSNNFSQIKKISLRAF